ncbi:hypothetical protein [Flavimaricola marinus]|uniref:DUF304 domain-containing protein n=1 Tax=Flavimaricola marinus TaxID=1819565 RepID=A0A238LB75_9RHOB|nr:hypothetical protein [Flavimaricola marinus]SMY06822.1 hypothetical protein LOM8899_00952 [Flavimaricola marinus]
MADRLDLTKYLHPDETLLWQGRPDATGRATPSVRTIKAAGWVMAVCFAFFALMAWVNRAEMAGSWGIMGTFLGLSGLLSVVFLVFYPWLGRAALTHTRFGVSSSHAIILRGVWRTELLRYPVDRKADITAKGGSVAFSSWIETADRNGNGLKERKRHAIGFGGLTATEAEAAAKALRTIKGKASGPMSLTHNPKRTAA